MNNQKGSVILIVLMVLGIIGLMGVTLITQSRLDLQFSSSVRNYDRMFAAADGAAGMGIRFVKENRVALRTAGTTYGQYFLKSRVPPTGSAPAECECSMTLVRPVDHQPSGYDSGKPCRQALLPDGFGPVNEFGTPVQLPPDERPSVTITKEWLDSGAKQVYYRVEGKAGRKALVRRTVGPPEETASNSAVEIMVRDNYN